VSNGRAMQGRQSDIVPIAESAGAGIPQPDQPPEIGAIRLRERSHGTPGPMPLIAVRLVPPKLWSTLLFGVRLPPLFAWSCSGSEWV
jgi:hypothetical protein